MEAAIPGQSLTDEPRNFAWERPPEIDDPDLAIRYHMNRVADPEVLDNVLFVLDFGVPAKVLTKSMMTGAVSQGIHSIDVGLIAEPVVRKFVMKTADQAGVDYKEDFDKEEVDPMERASILVSAARATPKEDRDKGFDFIQELSESSEVKEEPVEEAPMEEEMKPKGLMARV